MKIIHCLNFFFPDHIAGTEVYTMSLIRELQKVSIESVVVIPNFGKEISDEYVTEGVRVIKYPETSVLDRELVMGKRKPDGLLYFEQLLKKETPEIVHFHEFSSSNGITQHHIHLAKQIGFKVIMTFHLSGYSCKTGNLMYKDESLCDGIIDIQKCTNCIYSVKHIPPFQKKLLLAASMLAYRLKIDTSNSDNRLGTALGFPFLINKLKKELYDLADDCDQLVVLTNWYRTILENNGIAKSKITHIAQGLPGNEEKKVEKQEFTGVLRLVYVGRISPVKGIHLLLEAMKQIPGDKISLDIYGEINQDDYAQKCIKDSELLPNVKWKGVVSQYKVVQTIAMYDILCLPSAFSEMSPIVIREAFAAGVPVLASDVYGNAEQVNDNGNGWLFKFMDSRDLFLKLTDIIDHPEKISDAKKNIPETRGFQEVATEYINLYKKITGITI